MKLPHVSYMLLRTFRIGVALACLASLTACSVYSPFLPSAGPDARRVIEGSAEDPALGIQVVDLTDAMLRRVVTNQQRQGFADVFGNGSAAPMAVGAGDVLEISVWEAPPAALFGTGTPEPRGVNSTSRGAVFPEQLVGIDGTISIPFAGTIQASGRTTQQVQEEIAKRLTGIANRPQVFVRVLRNASSTVTVVGEVTTSARHSLSPYGERLLDVLAASAGFRQAVGKITIQITRQVQENGRRVSRVVSMPLETIISDPAQNIVLKPGDVVTALFQTNSLTVLGATARNEEINFEAAGISLAQALARAGGLRDERANAMGVFLFRMEDASVVDAPASAPRTIDGRVPVIYKLDLKQPASFFVAQGFPVRNKDIVYVANAPAAELQKFLQLIANVVYPAVTIDNGLN
jgi:polysaccharide export outer membrane protein